MRQLLFQKLLPASHLFRKHPRTGLPRQRDPGEEGRTLALHRPVFALQRIPQGSPSFGGRGKHSPLWTCLWLITLGGVDQSQPGQLFQRVIDLRPGNSGPIPDLATLQFLIRLIAVHGPFRQQAEQHQVRRGQFPG